VIELYHVTKEYAGAERRSLDDVNLQVEKGEFCLLTGPSGAGKTTFLRLLFAAEKASTGQVFIRGKNLARLNRTQVSFLRRNLGVIFQDFKLLKHATVFNNVALALEVQGRPSSEVEKRVGRVLDQVGLNHKKRQTCDRLSGGEQQRVAIARALVTDPAILLCDEPTGNLDPERSGDIMDLLGTANARGATIIVATHDPSILNRHGSRVISLKEGKLVQAL
jgi:cell division transport system ATP-binding protein